MVLRNYKSLKKLTSTLNVAASTQYVSLSDVKDMSGNNVSEFYTRHDVSNRAANAMKNRSLRNDIGVVLGAGTAAEDATDYALDNDVTSSFSVSFTTSNQLGGSDVDYEYQEIFTITAINNSGSAITLSEVGLWRPVFTTDYDSSYTKNVLILRSLLETPIEVPAGGTANIAIVWKEG